MHIKGIMIQITTEAFWNLASLSVIAFFAYPIIRFAETANIFYLYFSLATILLDVSTKIVKQVAFIWVPSFISARPTVGALGCDIMCTMTRDSSGKPGFPSGHATVVTFVATVLYLQSKEKSQMLLTFCLLSVGLICLSRYKKHCHTGVQVIGGIIYGFGVGVVFNKFINIE